MFVSKEVSDKLPGPASQYRASLFGVLKVPTPEKRRSRFFSKKPGKKLLALAARLYQPKP